MMIFAKLLKGNGKRAWIMITCEGERNSLRCCLFEWHSHFLLQDSQMNWSLEPVGFCGFTFHILNVSLSLLCVCQKESIEYILRSGLGVRILFTHFTSISGFVEQNSRGPLEQSILKYHNN